MPAELNGGEPRRLLMTADAVGGVWHYALDLARAFAECGVTTTLALLGPAPSPPQRREAEAVVKLDLVETGLPLDWAGGGPAAMRIAAERIAALANEIRADLIQLNGSPLASLAKFPAPVIAVHHSCLATWWASVKKSPLPAEWRWHAKLTREHLASSSRAIAPSAAFASLTAEVYGLRERPRVVRNGRSTGWMRTEIHPQPVLFTAGRLWDEGKNAAMLDRAAARLDAPLFAAGPLQGPEGSSITLRHIEALGEISGAEVRDRLARQPVFVSAARYEPFGLAVLEAAQAGCALILSDIPTFRELWEGAAWFVAADDDAALAQAARHLLRDQDLRRRMGEAARARAGRFGMHRSARAMLALYAEVLKQKTSPPAERAA